MIPDLVLHLFFDNAFVADDFLQFFDDNGMITQLFLTLILLTANFVPPLMHNHTTFSIQPSTISTHYHFGYFQSSSASTVQTCVICL